MKKRLENAIDTLRRHQERTGTVVLVKVTEETEEKKQRDNPAGVIARAMAGKSVS